MQGWVFADSHGLNQAVARSFLVKHLPHHCFRSRDDKLFDYSSTKLMCDLSNLKLTSLLFGSTAAFSFALLMNLAQVTMEDECALVL